MTRKTLMIGMDAGDLLFIRENLSHLPTLAACLDRGQLRPLATTSNYLTGSVWPTFYTGAGPGVHGIYHHLQWDPQSMEIRRVSDAWLYQEPFWYEMSRRGLDVTVLDVPMTFPSRLSKGLEIINWGAHDQLGVFQCNDHAFGRDLEQRFGLHAMGPEIPVNKNRNQLEKIRGNLLLGVHQKSKLIRHLLTHTQWDFFLTVFGETHRGGHILWPDDDSSSVVPPLALLEVYQAVDREIGEILGAVDREATRVMIFAVHGMEQNYSQEHFVPGIMQQLNQAYLAETQPIENRHYAHSNVIRALRSSVPANLQNLVAQHVPVGLRDWVVAREKVGGLDWSRTPGFALLADYNGYVRFNQRGRERHGFINGSEAMERYRSLIQSGFRSYTLGDEHESLVSDTIEVQSKFSGPNSALLPDLVVTWENEQYKRRQCRGSIQPSRPCAIPGARVIIGMKDFLSLMIWLARKKSPIGPPSITLEI